MWKEIWKQFEDRGIIIKKGTVQDATFIESDPGKHGKKKPPVPPDPSILPIKENILDPTMPKKITKEEKKQAKIRAAKKKREERRDGRKCSKTRRSGMEHGQRRIRYHTSATSFTLCRAQIFHS